MGNRDAVDELCGILKVLPEQERYRALAEVLSSLAAEIKRNGDVQAAQSDSANQKVRELKEQNAQLQAQNLALQADLEDRDRELQAIKRHGAELDEISKNQRTRIRELQTELAESQTRMTGLDSDVHRLTVENETLSLKLQRAEKLASDYSNLSALEMEKTELNERLVQMGRDLERLRQDKEKEIAALRETIATARTTEGQEGGKALQGIWQELHAATPSLSDGHLIPTPQAAQNLAATLIALTEFAEGMDKDIRGVLKSFTRHLPAVKVQWRGFEEGKSFVDLVKETVAPVKCKPVGILKLRLRMLTGWTVAALIASDVAVESIASELENSLRGPEGMATDPNRRIREYLQHDGNELFMQAIRDLRGRKLAEIMALR